jgi:hypothetical protein
MHPIRTPCLCEKVTRRCSNLHWFDEWSAGPDKVLHVHVITAINNQVQNIRVLSEDLFKFDFLPYTKCLKRVWLTNFIRSNDWLIIYCFTSHSRIFHLHGDVTTNSEGLQNLGICLVLRAFEQGGIFIVPHLLWYGASIFQVSSEGPPHSVAFYDTQGDVENLF